MPRVTLRAYARHRGCALATVQRAINSGRIKKGRNGLIDVDAADRSWALRTRPKVDVDRRRAEARNAEPDHDQTGEAIQRARAVQVNYQARILEIEYQKRAGELLPREEVRKAIFNASRKVRDLFLNMGDRLGPVVVGLDVNEAVKAINDEVARILDELATPSENGNGRHS